MKPMTFKILLEMKSPAMEIPNCTLFLDAGKSRV